MTITDHLEHHCGKIAGGFSGLDGGIQIVEMPRGPVTETSVLATLGLSHHEMHASTSGTRFRLELVMLFRSAEGRRNLPGVLHQAALEAARDHHGLLRGDVIGPSGPLVERATVEALYASAPSYFPESFGTYAPADGTPAVAMVWLVPITALEARFVRNAGWEAFETELERQNPDLIDYRRRGMTLPMIASDGRTDA